MVAITVREARDAFEDDAVDLVPNPESGQQYRVRRLAWTDHSRQRAYQRLRREIFVDQLGWDIYVDDEGCEVDRYDIGGKATSIHTVYAVTNGMMEHLLGGLRIFQLRTWDDSMLFHEFKDAGMVPARAINALCARHAPTELLEVSRFAVQQGRYFLPPSQPSLHIVRADAAPTDADTANTTRTIRARVNQGEVPYDLVIARDLAYAALLSTAETAGRTLVLAIVDAHYWRIMFKSLFVFETFYEHNTHARDGYALVLIDLQASLRSIYHGRALDRWTRMTALCKKDMWRD